jgi:F-type H+-transporting ATPase subunit b
MGLRIPFLAAATLAANRLLTSTLVFAAEHGEAAAEHGAGAHGVPEWSELAGPLFWRSFNFLLFIGLLVFLLRKPLSAYLKARRREVEEVINASAERKAWAEQMVADYDRRLRNLDQEIAAIKTSLKKEGEEEGRRLSEQATSLAESIRREAQQLVAGEIDEFKADLRRKIIEKATAAAREALQKNLEAGDEERLTSEFLKNVREVRA